jgi:TRAP-type C4-dicarboxylate transport system substrate-binding protein
MKVGKEVLLCCLFVFCLSLFAGAAFAQTKPIELSYSVFQPPVHRNAVLVTEWSREVEKRTNGRVKITLFYGGTLTPPDKCYNGVVNGISDLGTSVFSYTAGKFPLTEVTDLPLGYKSGEQAAKLFNEYHKKFQPKEFDEVKMLYLYSISPGFLMTKSKPVRALEDLRGMKIRSTGTGAKIVSYLGATAVAMPITDTYDALSRGVVDGLLSPYEVLDGFRMADVVKYVTEDYGASYSLSFFVAINKAKWNSLPADIQQIMEKTSEEWIERTGKAADEIDKLGREVGQKRGVQTIILSKQENDRWANAVKPLLDEFVKDKKAKGLPADEALKFFQDRLK